MFVRQARPNEETWLTETLKQNEKEIDLLNPNTTFLVCSERKNKPLGVIQLIEYQTNDSDIWFELTNIVCLQQTDISLLLSQFFRYFSDQFEIHSTDMIVVLTERPSVYDPYGFTLTEKTGLPKRINERAIQKQTTLDKDIHPVTVQFDNLKLPRRKSHKVKDIQQEIILQGFSDTDELTYKYSVE